MGTMTAGGTMAAGALYSTFRLVPVTLRSADDCYQVTAVRFFGIQGKKIAPASATNPGGNNPWTEKPSNLLDDNIHSKFLDFNIRPVEFTFNVGVSPMSYEWVTGNDFPERDMLSWRLEGNFFATDADWTTLHTVSNYDTTQNRKTVVGPFLLFEQKGKKYTAADGSTQFAAGHETLQTWPEERNFDEWKKMLPWTRTLGKGTLYKVIAEAKALRNAFPTPLEFNQEFDFSPFVSAKLKCKTLEMPPQIKSSPTGATGLTRTRISQKHFRKSLTSTSSLLRLRPFSDAPLLTVK